MGKTLEPGLVQVYTGSGKGKTTAAWGQALRAAGHGWNVAIVRFLKTEASGEVTAAQALQERISVFGLSCPYDPNVDQRKSEKVRLASRRTFDLAREIIQSGRYELVVLDEINIALEYGFIAEEEVVQVMSTRPPHVNLVLTGRGALESIISVADVVTEMMEIKHPFASGEKARVGIDY